MAWLPVLRKELRLYFGSPVAWVLIAMFLVLSGFYFSQIFFIYTMQSIQASMNPMMGGGSLNPVDSIMRPLLHFMAVMLLFFVPMLTMRLFAEEKRSGTIELLLTYPVRDGEVLIGKFLAAGAVYAFLLALTLVYPAMLAYFARIEWAPILTGYLGLLLLGGAFLSVGILISSLTENQILAGFVSFCVLLGLWIVGWAADQAGEPWRTAIQHLSIIDHVDSSFGRGVLETKDIVYYVSFTALGLFFTLRSLESKRWRG
jgi:ABC-2 type transport system permease protein